MDSSLLICSEEMMEESPDVSLEIKERNRYKNQIPPQIILKQKEITAFSDTNLLKNQQVFPSMLEMEKLSMVCVDNYFRTVQDDVTPKMKTDVAIWMYEVCEEEKMHTAVFVRAAHYLDKFLSTQKVSRFHLQLLGAVCILISSKLTGTVIPPQKLVVYTANSTSTEMILEWERMVLSVLKWDMYGIISVDFTQHILNLLPKKMWDNATILERIKTFIAFCAVDYQFGITMPSIIASASVVAAMKPFLTKESLNQVLATIQTATKIDQSHLKHCVQQILQSNT